MKSEFDSIVEELQEIRDGIGGGDVGLEQTKAFTMLALDKVTRALVMLAEDEGSKK